MSRRFLLLAAALLLSALPRPVAALTLDAVADTFVNSDQTTMNFGNFTFAEVGVFGPPKFDIDRALLTFDLTTVPAGPVGRARLQFFLSGADPDPPNFSVTISRLASDFDENTVTWATQPAPLPVPSVMAIVGQPIGSVVTIDITELVRAQRAGAMPNTISLLIAASDESPTLVTHFFDLATKEADPPQPALLIIDNAASAAPALSGIAWALALALLAATGFLALRRRLN